jgi:hypothetical protein
MLKRYLMFKSDQGKKLCRLWLEIFLCWNKHLVRRKYSRKFKTIIATQRNYMNHQAKKRCKISLTLFYCSFNYIKLHKYQCIKLGYQCIKYWCMYKISCFNVWNYVYQSINVLTYYINILNQWIKLMYLCMNYVLIYHEINWII